MNIPGHICFIPDGNRRYARKHHLSLSNSYESGVRKGLEVVEWCKEIGVRDISFFGASRENILLRNTEESIEILKGVLRFCSEILKQSVHLEIFGDLWEERLLQNGEYQRLIQLLPLPASRKLDELSIYVGIAYSPKSETSEDHRTNGGYLSDSVPPIDLVIRTGKRFRLSGFLPFQVSNAELKFLPMLWEEFDKEAFLKAIRWYARQPRTY